MLCIGVRPGEGQKGQLFCDIHCGYSGKRFTNVQAKIPLTCSVYEKFKKKY